MNQTKFQNYEKKNIFHLLVGDASSHCNFFAWGKINRKTKLFQFCKGNSHFIHNSGRNIKYRYVPALLHACSILLLKLYLSVYYRSSKVLGNSTILGQCGGEGLQPGDNTGQQKYQQQQQLDRQSNNNNSYPKSCSSSRQASFKSNTYTQRNVNQSQPPYTIGGWL